MCTVLFYIFPRLHPTGTSTDCSFTVSAHTGQHTCRHEPRQQCACCYARHTSTHAARCHGRGSGGSSRGSKGGGLQPYPNSARHRRRGRPGGRGSGRRRCTARRCTLIRLASRMRGGVTGSASSWQPALYDLQWMLAVSGRVHCTAVSFDMCLGL